MNRILRIIGITSSSMIFLLLGLSACDEVGDYENDPRSIQVVIDEDPPRTDGGSEDGGAEDGGAECECECPSGDGTDPSEGPGKGKKPEKPEKPENPGQGQGQGQGQE
jgi:hypothetical protein